MKRLRMCVAAAVCVAAVLTASSANAITLSSPIQAGDVFGVNNGMSGLFQVRDQVRLGITSLTNVGGVFTDTGGDLWFCHTDSTTGLTVETIPLGQSTSVARITQGVHGVPAGVSQVRDILLDSNGDLYALFRPGGSGASVMKYTADGSGGFNAGTLVASTGDSFADGASGRLDPSADEAFLLTGSYSAQRLYSVQLAASNTVQSYDPPGSMTGQVALDPSRPDVLLYSHADGVYQAAFNTATGAIGGPNTLLIADPSTTSKRTDAMTFAEVADRLYVANRTRGNEIRYAAGPQLAAAAAGTPIDMAGLPLSYVGGDVYAMRDLAVSMPQGPQITLNSPIAPGDVFTVDANLQRLYHMRGNTAVTVIDFGGLSTIGGVFVDDSNALYITSGPAGNGSVDRIAMGDTTSTQVLRADELLGSTPVRDAVVAADGTVYVSAGNTSGAIVKFAPGPTGYSRTDLGTFGLNLQSDRGNGHLGITPDGGYLVTATRSSNRLGSMDTITGVVQTWGPSGGIPTLVGEVALSPDADFVVFGAGSGAPAYLYGLDFNSATGGFGASATLLNTDANLWIDALGFDPLSGSLYLCARDSKMYVASADVVAAAMGGSPFAVRDLPVWYQGGGVSVARDFAVVTPEPTTMLLLGGGLLALARRRRR